MDQDVDCEALYGVEPRGSKVYDPIPKDYHEAIPRPRHEGEAARRTLKEYHSAVVKSAEEMLKEL